MALPRNGISVLDVARNFLGVPRIGPEIVCKVDPLKLKIDYFEQLYDDWALNPLPPLAPW